MLIVLTKNSNHKATVEVINDNGDILGVPRLVSKYEPTDIAFLMSLNKQDFTTVSCVNATLAELCGDNEGDGPNRIGFDVPNENFPLHLIESNPENQTALHEVFLRDITQTRTNASVFYNENPELAFREALEHEAGLREPVIEWNDVKAFCCLDIDYHDVPPISRPDIRELERLIHRIKPLPYCWHMSHGKGCKLYYASKPGYSADELASVAGLMWSIIDPRSTFDLIKSTRHPLYKRTRDDSPAPCNRIEDIRFTHGAGDVSGLKRLLTGELDERDNAEFLQSRGWNVGQTLPHAECPISPTFDSKQCVFIGEAGIYCHKCASRGLGSSIRPGFIGYDTLSGTQFDSRLYRMVRNFVHLEHARITLSNLYPTLPIRLLETTYRVLLKIVHSHDDPRVNMAMFSGKGYIRVKGQWVTTDGEHALANNQAMLVKSLPAVLVPSEDEMRVDIPKYTAFQNSNDLTEFGYDSISLIRGAKIYGQFLPYANEETVKVIVRPEFKKHAPQYISPSRRMESRVAWGLIQQEFPGIDENYLRLLIASKGVSEGRLSQCTYLLVGGVSGSGKSTTVQIAAGICGDKASEPIFVPQIDRFRQSLMDASKESSFILINEIFKNARAAKLTPTQALDPMLSLTEDSRSHVLYVGSVPFGRLPVFVMTDISMPIEVEQDVQLSRRFTYYRLSERTYWENTFVQKRIRPHEFRLISADHNDAADCILSEVIDRWFQQPHSLADIAKSLSIQTLQQYSEETDNPRERMLLFYNAVCALPTLTGGDFQRYKGVGWKRIDRINTTAARELWEDFCDDNTVDGWGTSRRLQSEDWGKLLGTGFPVLMETRVYKKTILFLRFRSADSKRAPAWSNGVHYGEDD